MNPIDKIKEIIENDEELERRVDLLIDIYRKSIYLSNLSDRITPLTDHEYKILNIYESLIVEIPSVREEKYEYVFRELRILEPHRTIVIPPLGPGFHYNFLEAITQYKDELKKASEDAHHPIIRELAKFYYNLAEQTT